MPDGTVERSTNGGATWLAGRTGVGARLLAGSCWLAGASGTVLRTTDGSTWQRVSAPDTADLGSITATGPDNATVTTRDGRVFTRADGGRTWSQK